MAAEAPAAPSPRSSAVPPPEAETPQDLSQTRDSAASCQGESCCSEEFVLNRTFAVCDPEHTGLVLAGQVVEYLQALTGQSGEEGRLRALHRMLDAEAAGAALDLPTFHAVMREWIASCQQEGGSRLAEERDVASGDLGLVIVAGEGHVAPTAEQLEADGGDSDIVSPAEAAALRGRLAQLASRNAKLQRDAESAEELSARLAEETAQLKAQLRCSQQSLEQARAAGEELEDLKAVAKGLEEENKELRRRTRRLEQEQQCLRLQAEGLREENQQLLTEGHGLREQIQVLTAEVANMEAQLCRCSTLLSSHDAALAQARQRVEELTAALDEYNRVVQELQLETTRLHDRLGRTPDAWATRAPGEAEGPAQPLGVEMAATCWEREEEEEEEEDSGMAAAPAGDGEQAAKARPCARPWVLPWVLLLLLALPWVLPRGLPLRYRDPPPQ